MKLIELLIVVAIIIILAAMTTNVCKRFRHIWWGVSVDYGMHNSMLVEALEDEGHSIERITWVQENMKGLKRWP